MNKLNVKFIKASLIFILIIILSFALVGCKKTPTGKVVTSKPIVLKCTGETSAVLQDYCITPEGDTLKILIKNAFLTELRHVNIHYEGDKANAMDKKSLRIEINEQKVVISPIPLDQIGTLNGLVLQVFYFGNSGMEACTKRPIELSEVRECGEPVKRDPNVPKAPPQGVYVEE